MAKRKDEVPEAPACVHDEIDAYIAGGSPAAEAFAPGLFDEGQMPLPSMDEETPWRRRAGWIAALAREGSGTSETELRAPGVEAESLADPRQGRSGARGSGAPEATDPGEVELNDVRLLVVHPNLGTRKQVASVLAQLGLQVSTCGQTEQAILQVLHERPDAVLAELDVPGFDSIGMCRALHDRVPEIPVLLVAAGDDEGSYSLSMEAGAADYLRRPVTPDFVAERLRAVIARARAGTSERLREGAAPAEGIPRGTQNLSRELRRQELKIQSLFELSQNVVGCLELDDLYQGFMLTAMGQIGLASGALFHLDASSRVLDVVCRGIASREVRRLLDFRAGLGLYLLRAPQPLLLEEGIFPRELANEVRAARETGFGVACPMAAKGAPVGVALFGHKVSGLPFTADDLVMLTAVCNFAGPALEGARLYSELHRTYLSTVRAFVSSLEAKDAYTRGHSERVADYARIVGGNMGLGRHEIDMLVFGAVLHDIGKIGVAEGILNKPGPLTPEEWRIVRAHPEMGARIISNIEYLEPALGLILHHHERIDGRGYPHGLVGSDIELGTRIVTVVDSFDAMTTNRPYRQAMPVEKAIALLRGNAGRQFDPEIVERFIDLLEAGSIEVRP
ncbi:MAG TPA: HD domain-containing phosphohydrolase, partial [Candidatus Krumholzibacteria bacterium]|nr:HD domain-containing phosphohydrolase [Candidatus Krumholzibacteria bacterium]